MGEFDVTVIGGGINGVSVAAEAASRGLRTLLIHSRDLASGASAAPVTLAGTHLQHLSALDYFQLNSMLEELQRLKSAAPHLVDLYPVCRPDGTPLKEKGNGLIDRIFQGIRDRALAQLCNRQDPAAHSIAARIKPARLILARAQQAASHGAELLPRHELVWAERGEEQWKLGIVPTGSDRLLTATSKLVINCAGWRANSLLEKILQVSTRCRATEEHRTQFFFTLDKASLPNSTRDHVLKLQGPSEVPFYVYPVADDLFAFGPRKCDQAGYAECVDLLQQFIDTWNQQCEHQGTPLTRDQFIYKRKCQFALIQDPCGSDDSPMAAPLLDLNNPGKQAVLLNIFGVDVVLSRRIASQALDVLQPFTGKKANPEFSLEKLPGAGIGCSSADAFQQKLQQEYPQLPAALLGRLSETYGENSLRILANAQQLRDLGCAFSEDLYEAEVRYLAEQEWASDADDVLLRRTLLGINATDEMRNRLEDWFATRAAG